MATIPYVFASATSPLPLSQLDDNFTSLTVFTPSGTGAVATTVEAKLRESVSITDFGAVSGGSAATNRAAIQAAHNAHTAVWYPKGTYQIDGSIVLQSGARIYGECANAGGGSAPSTVVEITTSDFAYTMDAPLIASLEGPRFDNIQISCKNGVRLNTIAGGQPGTGGTQGFINNASFKRTLFFGTGSTGTAVQASVCFHLEFTEQSEALGFANALDIYYSDFVLISHNRLWQCANSLIRLTAANTFGSHSVIEKNDLLSIGTGATAFIVCNDYSPHIRNNYIEQTAAQGIGLIAAISIGSTVHRFCIEFNAITMPGACAPNWLNVTSGGSLSKAVITSNSFDGTGIGPAIFNANAGLPVFYSGGNGRTSCIHFGNTFETGIPFNTKTRADLPITTYKQVSNITPSLFGAISGSNYGTTAYIKNNALVIPAPATGANIVYLNDPDIAIVGTCAIYILAHADGAQTNTAALFDGGIYMGIYANLALTTTPTWFVVSASATPTTNLSINCTNSVPSGSGGVNMYIDAISIVRP